MSYHSNDEEQFQEIKEFLANTWKIIVTVIAIGLLAIWGWRYWQSYQKQKNIEASDKYEQLVANLSPENLHSVDELVLFAKDTDTIYSVFANLKAAQFYVEGLQDYAQAEALLIDAGKKTDSEPVLSIINIRVARLQYQLEKYTESLQTLDRVLNESWAAVVNDIRGDVLIKMERYAEACNAYEVALVSSPTPELEKNIKMKLNQANYLKAKQQAQQAKIEAQKQVTQDQDNAPLSSENPTQQ